MRSSGLGPQRAVEGGREAETEHRPSVVVHQLARLLPAGYAERLAWAAADRSIQGIDAITDELARRYPSLVRHRAEYGRFAPLCGDRDGGRHAGSR